MSKNQMRVTYARVVDGDTRTRDGEFPAEEINQLILRDMKKTLLLLIFTYYFLGCSKKQEITPYKSIYKSECNITDPQTDLKWIDKLNILTWNQVKGSYLYVYYGYIEKSDSDLLAKGSYFDKINPREIIILRLSREKRDNIKIEDWILIYDCSGNLLVEGWLDEWLTLPSKLKDKYVFDIRQI